MPGAGEGGGSWCCLGAGRDGPLFPAAVAGEDRDLALGCCPAPRAHRCWCWQRGSLCLGGEWLVSLSTMGYRSIGHTAFLLARGWSLLVSDAMTSLTPPPGRGKQPHSTSGTLTPPAEASARGGENLRCGVVSWPAGPHRDSGTRAGGEQLVQEAERREHHQLRAEHRGGV